MKSIEGLTIEELEALKIALCMALIKSEKSVFIIHNENWINLLADISQQISDQQFEQERKDNLPIEP